MYLYKKKDVKEYKFSNTFLFKISSFYIFYYFLVNVKKFKSKILPPIGSCRSRLVSGLVSLHVNRHWVSLKRPGKKNYCVCYSRLSSDEEMVLPHSNFIIKSVVLFNSCIFPIDGIRLFILLLLSMICLVLLLILILDVYSLNTTNTGLDSEYGQVIFSSVLFRHGERSPFSIYPSDPYGASSWPMGLEELTNKGKLEEYELGQWYRKWYSNLLGNGYSADTIYMFSADCDRTIESGECFLAGLYPPRGSEVWNPNLLWQPIPVHSISSVLDNMIALTAPCPMKTEELDSLNKLPFFTDFYKNNEQLFKYIEEHTGLELTGNDVLLSMTNISYLYDTLNCQSSIMNVSLPRWAIPVYSFIAQVSLMDYAAEYFNDELKRLNVGPFLHMVVSNMNEKRDGTLQPNRTLVLYSGIDHNIVGLLMTLGVYDNILPPYASSVMIELRKKDDEYNVLVLYKNTTNVPYVMEMPDCPLPCSLDQFVYVTSKFIPDDWNEECAMQNQVANWSLMNLSGLFVPRSLLICSHCTLFLQLFILFVILMLALSIFIPSACIIKGILSNYYKKRKYDNLQ